MRADHVFLQDVLHIFTFFPDPPMLFLHGIRSRGLLRLSPAQEEPCAGVFFRLFVWVRQLWGRILGNLLFVSYPKIHIRLRALAPNDALGGSGGAIRLLEGCLDRFQAPFWASLFCDMPLLGSISRGLTASGSVQW